MHEMNIVLTITVALAVGLIFGYITNLLKWSPIVGYLLAGIVIGPFTPGFTADQDVAHQLAEIGVMLLMFGVGLHFHIEHLWQVRLIAIPGAVIQVAVATLLGAGTAHLFGWGWDAGLLFGLSLSVASTVVLTRVLLDNRQLHTWTGRVAIGWLVVEDLFTVLVLVVLPALFAGKGQGVSLASELGFLAVKILALVAAVFVLGQKFIPWIFAKAAKSSSQELFTLTVLVTALGVAVSSAILFDVSMALGAFLAGMVVGKSEFSLRAASEVLPLRDAFAVLFFVSIGMLLDPQVLLAHAPLIGVTLAVVVVGKTIGALAIVLLLGYPLKVALGVSVALAQIGEFSFILASLGKQLGILDELALNVLVATAIVSISLNPLLFRFVTSTTCWIEEAPWLSRLLSSKLRERLSFAAARNEVSSHDKRDHAIVVGYGPIGKAVTRLLDENGIQVTIIELNLETTRKLKATGRSVVYGDAIRRETLTRAKAANARVLILSASNISSAQEIVRQAKSLNDKIRIFAITAYAGELRAMRQVGCDAVFSGESEVALALIGEVLNSLGATSEQIERERARFRKEVIEQNGDGV